ncbi:hypothetical protein ACI6Q2_06490 [Chitinophagaceae bacterium LWZ2-11]
MVRFDSNKLVIEIETPDPLMLLHELQVTIIKLLRLRDENQQTDRTETHSALELLSELLITGEE